MFFYVLFKFVDPNLCEPCHNQNDMQANDSVFLCRHHCQCSADEMRGEVYAIAYRVGRLCLCAGSGRCVSFVFRDGSVVTRQQADIN